MRKNVSFAEKVEKDYRKRIIIDKDNPVLAFKALRDRFTNIQGKWEGYPHLGSNASEDALTWNVFRTLYEKKKLSYFLKDYKLGRIQSVALWGTMPDSKHLNKRFQYELGMKIRDCDGILPGQTTEPDVVVFGSSGVCVIECKLGHPNKPVSHLWSGQLTSINKRLPLYSKEIPEIVALDNERSEKYYQLIRMAFYARVLAGGKLKAYLISCVNQNNWDIKLIGKEQAPKDIWGEFVRDAQGVFKGLNFGAIFWQDLLKIREIRRIDTLYRYLKHHPCL